MNMSGLFSGDFAEWEAYKLMIKKKCISKGLNPPDFSLMFPFQMYFRKESLNTILENTMEFDYMHTPSEGRWNGWKTKLLSIIFGLVTHLTRWKPIPVHHLNKSVDATKSWHIMFLGLKEDRKNKDGSEFR